jgi:hypothetical protein
MASSNVFGGAWFCGDVHICSVVFAKNLWDGCNQWNVCISWTICGVFGSWFSKSLRDVFSIYIIIIIIILTGTFSGFLLV